MSRVDAKVVLLGKSYVGKTCIVNKYVHNRFDPNLPYQNTIGAAFAAKKVVVGDKSINLGIWDTAGHERYESMTRMYYRGASACILCYDITDRTSFDRVRFWASELQATEKDCKIYLCGTKVDIVRDRQSLREVERKMAEPLAQDFCSDLYETSSVTGENIDELFQTIARELIEKKAAQASIAREQEEATVHLTEGRGSGGWSLRGCAFPRCSS